MRNGLKFKLNSFKPTPGIIVKKLLFIIAAFTFGGVEIRAQSPMVIDAVDGQALNFSFLGQQSIGRIVSPCSEPAGRIPL
jgi:hypothetical protein